MELNGGIWVTPSIQLVRRLDEGAMGSVWVAHHLTLGTEVAVKFVITRLADQSIVLKRLEAEAKNAARIKSPHAVRTFDFGLLDDGTPYIVMELLEGLNLQQRIEAGPALTPREVAVVVMHAARCLHGAHQLGIVHRDIKPENLFLLDDDELFIKVLDFGIAKGLGKGVTQPGMLIGTLPYMSRDRLVDQNRLDHRADLWSLTVVAYEALTGELPFDGETHDEICAAIWRGDFAPPSELNPALNEHIDNWFRQALHKERSERPATAKQLAASFVRAVGTIEGVYDSGEHDDWRISQLDLTPYSPPSTPLAPTSEPPRSDPGSSLRPISYPGTNPPHSSHPPGALRTPTPAPESTARPTLDGIPTLPPPPSPAWRTWAVAATVAASVGAAALALRTPSLPAPAMHGASAALAQQAAHAAGALLERTRADEERERAIAERERSAAQQAEAAAKEVPSPPPPALPAGKPLPKPDSRPNLDKDLGF